MTTDENIEKVKNVIWFWDWVNLKINWRTFLNVLMKNIENEVDGMEDEVF